MLLDHILLKSLSVIHRITEEENRFSSNDKEAQRLLKNTKETHCISCSCPACVRERTSVSWNKITSFDVATICFQNYSSRGQIHTDLQGIIHKQEQTK